MFDFTNGEFKQNLNRINNLMSAYRELDANDIGDIQVRKDVLRACVVLMHSTLEEVIRNLYLYRLPKVDSKQLNKITFVGHTSSNRPSNILLGELLQYRDKLVSNVILASIESHVDTMNINSALQLAQCLEMAEIPVDTHNKYFAELESLMKRRHQIVHQMDRSDRLDPLSMNIENIGITKVNKWKSALRGFFYTLNKTIKELEE